MASRVRWNYSSEVSLFLTDGELQPINAAYTLWSQVYTTRPQRSEILSSSGGILPSAITTFTQDITTGGIQLSLPAIEDPNPESDESEEVYYLGVRYQADAGPAQAAIAALKMARVELFLSRLDITQSDIEGVDRNIKWLFGSDSPHIQSISEQVEQELVSFFRSRKIDPALIQNWAELKYAGLYKALEIAHISEIEVEGDSHDIKAQRYAVKAQEALSQYAADVRGVDQVQADDNALDNSFGSIRVMG